MPPGKSIPGKKTTPGKVPAKPKEEEEKVDPNKLPDGFVPPPEAPAWLTTTEECREEPFSGDNDREKSRDKSQKMAKYNDILRKGVFSGDEDKKLVASIIRWQLCRMTQKENRDSAHNIRTKEILRDLRAAIEARGAGKEVRVFMMQTIAEKAPELFEYHLVARLNAAILLAELSDWNEVEKEGRNPAVRCTRAVKPLIDLVKDSKQPAVVRLWGVKGLAKLAEIPDLKTTVRDQIVEALVEKLNDGYNEHWWYQMRLAEGLVAVKVLATSKDKQKPIVVQALAEAVVDPRREWQARAAAANAIGQLPFDGSIDLGVIAYGVADLARQMTDAYQKTPKSDWRPTFLTLYGSFISGESGSESGLLTQVQTSGKLAPHKKSVQEAYDLVVPLVQKVITNPQGIDTSLAKLKEWLKANSPKVNKISQDMPPLNPARTSSPAAPPSANGGTTAS